MKLPLLSALALATTTSLVAGCSERAKKDADPVVSTPPPAIAPATVAPATVAPAVPAPTVTTTTVTTTASDPFADIAVALDTTTKATTANLAAPQERMNKVIDAQVAAWKSAATLPTTVMADEKLSLARADFTQKLRDLSLQGDETWKNAKDAAQTSLQNLRRVYAEYLAGPPKN